MQLKTHIATGLFSYQQLQVFFIIQYILFQHVMILIIFLLHSTCDIILLHIIFFFQYEHSCHNQASLFYYWPPTTNKRRGEEWIAIRQVMLLHLTIHVKIKEITYAERPVTLPDDQVNTGTGEWKSSRHESIKYILSLSTNQILWNEIIFIWFW